MGGRGCRKRVRITAETDVGTTPAVTVHPRMKRSPRFTVCRGVGDPESEAALASRMRVGEIGSNEIPRVVVLVEA